MLAEATKRLLLLDVDGVLNPLSNRPPPGFRTEWIDGFEVAFTVRHARWLTELADSFELLWASTWEDSANESIGPLLRLPPLPVIHFSKERVGDTCKLNDVRNFVGDRPCVCIDDELFADAFKWADDRPAPTLAIRPAATVGMTITHFEQVCEFRDRHC